MNKSNFPSWLRHSLRRMLRVAAPSPSVYSEYNNTASHAGYIKLNPCFQVLPFTLDKSTKNKRLHVIPLVTVLKPFSAFFIKMNF